MQTAIYKIDKQQDLVWSIGNHIQYLVINCNGNEQKNYTDIYICMQACKLSCSVVFESLWPHGLQLTRLLCPWDFPRLEYKSGLPFPPPEDLLDPGIKLESPEPPALGGRFSTTEPRATWEADTCTVKSLCCAPKTHTILWINYT